MGKEQQSLLSPEKTLTSAAERFFQWDKLWGEKSSNGDASRATGLDLCRQILLCYYSCPGVISRDDEIGEVINANERDWRAIYSAKYDSLLIFPKDNRDLEDMARYASQYRRQSLITMRDNNFGCRSWQSSLIKLIESENKMPQIILMVPEEISREKGINNWVIQTGPLTSYYHNSDRIIGERWVSHSFHEDFHRVVELAFPELYYSLLLPNGLINEALANTYGLFFSTFFSNTTFHAGMTEMYAPNLLERVFNNKPLSPKEMSDGPFRKDLYALQLEFGLFLTRLLVGINKIASQKLTKDGALNYQDPIPLFSFRNETFLSLSHQDKVTEFLEVAPFLAGEEYFDFGKDQTKVMHYDAHDLIFSLFSSLNAKIQAGEKVNLNIFFAEGLRLAGRFSLSPDATYDMVASAWEKDFLPLFLMRFVLADRETVKLNFGKTVIKLKEIGIITLEEAKQITAQMRQEFEQDNQFSFRGSDELKTRLKKYREEKTQWAKQWIKKGAQKTPIHRVPLGALSP